MEKISIALAQTRPVPGDTKANAEKTAGYIKDAASKGADLVMFAECSLTGYAPERAVELAVSFEDDALQGLRALSAGLGIALCIGYMERSKEELFIAQELCFGGKSTVYRKTHLGSKEALFFSEGSAFPVAEIPVITGMQLCWESHLPQISAVYRGQGAQLLLFPYASGMSGERCLENWSVHLPARASDNGCFAAACNLLKKEGALGGGMAVWDAKGKLIAGYCGTDEHLMLCGIGGPLPRETGDDMHSISYFDRIRPELF